MTMNSSVPVSVLRIQMEAIKASMDNHPNTRELALAKTKIEEGMMWLNQYLYLNPEATETQDELPLFAEQKAEEASVVAPVKKKVIKAEPKVETKAEVAQKKASEEQPKPAEVKLPSKEEMIQLAKDFGKKNGIEAFLNLLKPFNCKNVSEVYELGTEAVQKFYSNLNS